VGRNDPHYGAKRPVILGAERPAMWGGTTHDVGGSTHTGWIDHGAVFKFTSAFT